MLICCLTTTAQETGNWRAASSTARSITGDIGVSSEKLFINFTRFTISRIRTLEPAEVSATFDTDSNSGGTGSLYRLAIPADKKFLNKSTLCGSEQTQWMAAFATGGTLKLAFFSGSTPPVFTLDAIQNSTDLCGTFTYVR
jgi:hypothetical protein